MAHMFRVDYITNHVSGMVEIGKAIVVAESHDLAQDIVATQLKLPISRTRFESSKIKPPCYVVSNHQEHPDKKRSIRNAGEAQLAPRQHYTILVEASNVGGQSEQQVMRKVGEELQARGAQTKLKHNLQMSVECFTSPPKEGQPTTMEKIEFYRPSAKPVQGGRVNRK